MCGRYVIVSKVEVVEKKFNVRSEFDFEPNYNVVAGALVPIIKSSNPKLIVPSHFGFTPSFAQKKMYVINARSEGDHNKENHPEFNGAKGILKKPYFRKAIRSQRCIVPADAFVEGSSTKKLDEPYLVYLKDKQRPFAFAGIYDEWEDLTNGEIYSSFAVITCPPNKLMQKINHHRMPVILEPENYIHYLNIKTPLSAVTNMLHKYEANKMNAFKISTDIKNPKNNNKELLTPISEWVNREKEIKITTQINLFGMGEGPAKKRRDERI